MKRLNIFLLIAALLLSSCNTTPVSISITKNLTSLTEVEETRENDNSTVSQTLSAQANELAIVAAPALNSLDQERGLIESNGFLFHQISVPKEVILRVLSELPLKAIIQASQVCQGWYTLSEEPSLWRTVRSRIHGDYLAGEATKERAKLHMLQVQAYMSTDLISMEKLIAKYNLNKHRPFMACQDLTFKLLKESKELTQSVNDELAIQGNERAIERKMKGLCKGTHGYQVDLKAAFYLNEALVKQGNGKAISRKIFGFDNGFYGYDRALASIMSFIEHLIAQDNEAAVDRKVVALTYGFYGYKKDPEAARLLNELWVAKGSIKAMERKVKSFAYGLYGYEVDEGSAVALNEALIKQGNSKAVRRKTKGFINGHYGYEENPAGAVTFNERLIEQDNEEAIIKKVIDLSRKIDVDDEEILLYQPDAIQLEKWLVEELSKGKRWACYLKAKGLKYGILGYEKNREAAIEYIKKHSIPY
jgi:hypothetical protein